jgi:nucleoside-diphosphate-sugar epimerase
MKVLVTGASGFIGSNIVERLTSLGHDVRCLIRETSKISHLKSLPVQFQIGDITDYTTLPDAVNDVDWVVHTAGIIRARRDEDFYKVNYGGTVNLIKAVLLHSKRLKRFVHISSLSVAGPSLPMQPHTEANSPNPITTYGETKLLGEQEVLSVSYQIPVVVLRPSVVYGPRDRGMFNLFKTAKMHIALRVGFSRQYISLVYISDLVDACLLALERETPSGSVYFLDDGAEGHNLITIQRMFARAQGKWCIPLFVPKSVVWVVSRVNGVMEWVSGKSYFLNPVRYREMVQSAWTCTSIKIQTELGFKPEFNLERGSYETAKWYKENGWF